MNDFDMTLLNSEALLKRGYMSVINNAGKAIAAITLFVAVLVTFTDIGFVGRINQSVTGTVLTLLLASYLMYFSMESAGERLGFESEEYRTAYDKYSRELGRIRPSDIYALRRFCTEYAERELRFRREGFLMRHGLGLADYEKFKSGGAPTRLERRIFKKAEKMKPTQLTPSMLTSAGRASKSELQGPEKTKLFSMIAKLLPATASVFFTGAIVLGAKDGLDAMGVIESIMKLSALPIIAIKGYVGGYTYAKEKLSVWLETKTKLLSAFLSGSEDLEKCPKAIPDAE